MKITKVTRFELVGRGALDLHPNDHIATGGEGSIFRPGGSRTAIKLYTDTAKMRRDGMPEKIELLSKIKHPNIVSPTGLVLYSGEPVGYYMPFTIGEVLSPMFTTGWRQANSFDTKETCMLVDRMREAVIGAHAAKAVMVDANELNWIVNFPKKNDPVPRAIDVDSWAIGRWKATVIMPSIMDHHTKGFTPMSDWFSWGIVTFQLFSGLHPYKGMLDGYKPGDMERRMKDNASVFAPGVRLNNAVRDFKTIPGPLLDWYVSEFKDGKRSIPPSPFDTGVAMTRAAQITRVAVTSRGTLIYDKVFDGVNDPVVRLFPCGVVLQRSGTLTDIQKKKVIGYAQSKDCEVVFQEGKWVKADVIGGKLSFIAIDAQTYQEHPLDLNIEGTHLVRYEDRLFVVTANGLTEVMLKVFAKPVLAVGNTWGALVNSTRWYDGVGIQDTFGATYLLVPFGSNSCAHVRVRELDGLRPIAAQAGNRFVAIMTVDKKGQYKKVELTFDRDYKTYQVWQNGSDAPDLNMTALPKGVVAIITDDGELNVFVPTTGVLNQVNDSRISTNMLLVRWGDKVHFIEKGSLWSLRQK